RRCKHIGALSITFTHQNIAAFFLRAGFQPLKLLTNGLRIANTNALGSEHFRCNGGWPADVRIEVHSRKFCFVGESALIYAFKATMQRLIMPDFTPEQLRRYLPSASAVDDSIGAWWIGFSGGLDSTLLLHALVQLKLPVTLNALHINHQISPYADSWQQQCEAVCRELGVAFYAEKVQVKNTGKGIEDAAREAQ